MSPEPARIRFHPPRGRLVVLLVACLIVGAMGVVIILLNLDNVTNLLIGGAAVGLFGLGGGASLVRQLGSSTLRADAEGLHVGRVGTAPWSDIDRVGTTAQGELGVRLRRSDALLTGARRDVTRESLHATRAASGYDLVFAERDLGRPPKEAAAALRGFLR